MNAYLRVQVSRFFFEFEFGKNDRVQRVRVRSPEIYSYNFQNLAVGKCNERFAPALNLRLSFKIIALQSYTTAQKASLTNASKNCLLNFTADTRCRSKRVRHATHVVSTYVLEYSVWVYSRMKSSYIGERHYLTTPGNHQSPSTFL